MISPKEIREASSPPVIRIVQEATDHLLEYIEVERGDDGSGVDICRYLHEDGQPPAAAAISLIDEQAVELARGVLAIADPGAVVLTETQAKRLAQLATLLDITTPCRAFYENDEIVRDLRGIAGELRRMSGRVRLVVVS